MIKSHNILSFLLNFTSSISNTNSKENLQYGEFFMRFCLFIAQEFPFLLGNKIYLIGKVNLKMFTSVLAIPIKKKLECY
ncbi:hypothetical protein SAMN05216556_1242 [Aequorivita viscosa]|uniref:Uncharacterized protein n=1 Tax=Aequorivita viscosa TaxID=797419 RepID=A0A1M6M533_9FLAO|nr:hypothetical protein SAMN05216556_1242 [Aequorivita viscosa]SHJ78562.1 hypothetical protein SAMN04487908_12558 [Aequorivita viscosa]